MQPGNYSVQVIGASDETEHSVTLRLIVQAPVPAAALVPGPPAKARSVVFAAATSASMTADVRFDFTDDRAGCGKASGRPRPDEPHSIRRAGPDFDANDGEFQCGPARRSGQDFKSEMRRRFERWICGGASSRTTPLPRIEEHRSRRGVLHLKPAVVDYGIVAGANAGRFRKRRWETAAPETQRVRGQSGPPLSRTRLGIRRLHAGPGRRALCVQCKLLLRTIAIAGFTGLPAQTVFNGCGFFGGPVTRTWHTCQKRIWAAVRSPGLARWPVLLIGPYRGKIRPDVMENVAAAKVNVFYNALRRPWPMTASA